MQQTITGTFPTAEDKKSQLVILLMSNNTEKFLAKKSTYFALPLIRKRPNCHHRLTKTENFLIYSDPQKKTT